MEPVQALAASSRVSLFDLEHPGAFFVDTERHLFFCECPCGCGGHMALPIFQAGESKPAPTAWLWNGFTAEPTLHPSIRDMRGCRFHGHIRAGVWTFEGDSGVK